VLFMSWSDELSNQRSGGTVFHEPIILLGLPKAALIQIKAIIVDQSAFGHQVSILA
jgi:hypothetical protein